MIQNLKLIHVRPSKTNPRKNFDGNEIQQLADSIKQHGVLQPVLVREDLKHASIGGAQYELVAGERRYRAALLAGKEDIPAIVAELSDVEVLEIQVIENMQRSDLHPLEEAHGYQALLATKKYDVARIAERVGRSARYIYDRVKLLELIPDLQKHFSEGTITAGHAVLLARLSPADQKRCAGAETGSRWERGGGLFTHEASLFEPDHDEEENPRLKAISVKELEAWIAHHVKFDRARAATRVSFPRGTSRDPEVRDHLPRLRPTRPREHGRDRKAQTREGLPRASTLCDQPAPLLGPPREAPGREGPVSERGP